jgi:hypothetical protein
MRSLGDRAEEARAQLQDYLSRMTFPTSATPVPPLDEGALESAAFHRRPASIGAHPEITLVDEDLRLMGRVDLLTVTDDGACITDYKTGAEDPAHRDQVTLYALLWSLDRIVNPEQIPVTELVIAYPSHDLRIAAPGLTDLDATEQALRQRIEAADRLAATVPPQARPAPDQCGFCPVRGLCGAYWADTPNPASLRIGAWFDYEGIVGPQNGVRSLWMLDPNTGQRQILLRTPSTAPPLSKGTRVRLLSIRLEDDAEVEGTVALMTIGTEVLMVAP